MEPVAFSHKGDFPKLPKNKEKKPDDKISAAELKKKQKEEFKQSLKEAILISRGEIEGIPLSDLWNE